MVKVTTTIDGTDLSHQFDGQEISIICSQICVHVLELLRSHYGSDKINYRAIDKVRATIELRLGVMGRVSVLSVNHDPTLKVEAIAFITSVLKDDDDIETVTHEHSLDKKSFGEISPTTFLDFLIILLKEGVNAIRATFDNPMHEHYGRETAASLRSLIMEVYPLAKIPYLPRPDSNAMLVALMVDVETEKPLEL
jgi:hypothetical protein